MNLILLFQNDFTGTGSVILHGRRMEHMKKVQGAQQGDEFNIGLLNDRMGKGIIIRMEPDAVEMKIVLDHEPPAPLPLTLILALPRPKMLRRILQSISSLGVKEIFLLNTWRVEKSFWSSPLLQQEKLEAELILGLEQAKDTIMPRIHLRHLFMPFVTEDLPQIAAKDNPVLLTAHPGGGYQCPKNVNQKRSITQKNNVNQKTILAMGPEGGFIDAEVKSLEQAGFTTVNLGSRILRLETAVPYIISKLF